MSRINNPVIHPIADADKARCAERAKSIQAKPHWSSSDAVRFAFYSVEGNMDPSKLDEVIEQAAAVVNACLAKRKNLKPGDQLFSLFGVRPGSTEAELLQARSFAANMLRDAQDKEAHYELEIEQLKSVIAEQEQKMAQLEAEKQDLVSQRDAAIEAHGKTSAELQTALAAQTGKVDNTEVEKLKQQLETAMKTMEAQTQRLLKYAQQPKFDEEVTEVLDFITKRIPAGDTEMKLALYFLNASILGKG